MPPAPSPVAAVPVTSKALPADSVPS
jgi:hypothetical protein